MNARLHPRKTSIAAGVSVAALLWLCVILLIAALGVVSFFLKKANSRQSKTDQELETARAVAAQVSNIVAKIEKDKATNAAWMNEIEKRGRIATAQAARTRFAARAQETTNRLHAILERIPLASKELQDFTTGEGGKPVSPYPELVQRAGAFISTGPKIPSTQTCIAHIENLRRYLGENADNFNTEVAPAAAAEVDLEQARDWANKSDADMDGIRGTIKALLTSASQKSGLGNKNNPIKPLNEALDDLNQKINQIEFDKMVTATNAARTITTQSKTNEVVQKALLDAEQKEKELERIRLKEEERQKKLKLIAEAQSFETQKILAPFITAGAIDVNGRELTEKAPHSWGQLGSILNSTNPHHRLNNLASSPRDAFRPRWGKADVRNNRAAYEQADQAIQSLRRLGPVLVELGMLRP